MEKPNNSALNILTEQIIKAIDAKISDNNRKYIDSKFKNLRISGEQIKQNTISGTSLAPNSIPTLKVRDFVAECAQIAVAEIASATIDTAQIENLSAHIADITIATIQNAEIDWANISSLTTAIAYVAVSQIQTATIGFAQIDGLTAGTALITEMLGGKVAITDLAVTDANIVTLNANKITAGTLSVERLIIAGSDKSIVYAVNEINGTAQLSQTTIDGGSITRKTITAEQIIANGITAECLNVTEIFANEALINAITSKNINVAELFASTATLGIVKAANIDVVDLFATNATLKIIKAKHVDTDELFADEATFKKVKSRNIDTDEFLASSGMVHSITGDHLDFETVQLENISTQAIKSIGDSIDISSNEGINIVVGNTVSAMTENIVGQQISLKFENGTYLDDSNKSTKVSVQVFSNGRNIVNTIPNECFIWSRKSTNSSSDAAWNASHIGLKEFLLTTNDVEFTSVIRCHIDISLTLPTFEYSNGDLYLIESQVDVGDHFYVEDGYFYSATADYSMLNGVLYVNGRDVSAVPTEATVVDRTDDPYIADLESEIALTQSGIALMVSKGEHAASINMLSDSISQKVSDEDHTASINMLSDNITLGVIPSGKVVSGSSVLIDENNVNINTKNFSVSAPVLDANNNPTDEAQMQVDRYGLTADKINSPSVASQYDGGAVVTVRTDGTGDFTSLRAAMEDLNGCHIANDITINVQSGITLTEDLTIRGLFGGGEVTINANGATLRGTVTLRGNSTHLVINDLIVKYRKTTGSAIAIRTCQSVVLGGCNIDGNNSNGSAISCQFGSTVRVSLTEMYNATNLISAANGAFVSTDRIKGGYASGGTFYGLRAQGGGMIQCYGTIPAGSVYETGNGQIRSDGTTVDSGAAPAPVPPMTTTTYVANLSGSYRSGWEDTSYIKQGYTTNGEFTGAFWVNNTTLRADLSGKTILSASLTLRRKSGYGKGDKTKIYLHGITATGKSGAPGRSKNYGSIGTIMPGKTKEFAIPTAAVTDLVAGTIQGLALYAGDGSTMAGQVYSTNYCYIYGVGSDAPVLTVTA